MSEERIMVLTMLQEGKISSDEAAKLLDALDETELKDFDPMKNFSSNEYKKYENKFEDLGEKISAKIEEHSEKLENWGNNIAEGTDSFTDKVLNFVDSLTDKGSFINIFGVHDTIVENIEKDISEAHKPSLEMQAINGKITVKPWDKEIISVKAVCQLRKGSYDKNNPVYEVIEDGERYIFKPKYPGSMGIRLDVYIPEKHYERIFLFTSNGKIEVDDVISKELLFDTSNASIKLNGLDSTRIKACTKNGRIIANNINSELFDTDTSNASIEISDINSTYVEASTRNGKILTSDIISNKLNLTTSNSQIIVQDCSSKTMKCRTSNASIKVEDIDTLTPTKIELNTSNGQIELTFNEKNAVFNLDTKTSMGHIDIDIPNLIYTLNNQQNLGNKKILAHSSNFTSEDTSINIIASTSNGSVKIG